MLAQQVGLGIVTPNATPSPISVSVQAQMQDMQRQAAQAQAQAQQMLAAQAQQHAQQQAVAQQQAQQQVAAQQQAQQQAQQLSQMQAAAVAQMALAQQTGASNAFSMHGGASPMPAQVLSQQQAVAIATHASPSPQSPEPLRNKEQLNRLQARLHHQHQQQLAAAANAAVAAAQAAAPAPTPPMLSTTAAMTMALNDVAASPSPIGALSPAGTPQLAAVPSPKPPTPAPTPVNYNNGANAMEEATSTFRKAKSEMDKKKAKKTPPSSGGGDGFEDDTLDILWGMVVEEGGGDDLGNMLDGGNLGAMLEGGGDGDDAEAAAEALLDDVLSSRGSGMEGIGDDEGDGDVNGGYAAAAAAVEQEAGLAAVAAFEKEMRAAKRSLDENKARGASLPASIAAELAAAVDAAAGATDDDPAELQRQQQRELARRKAEEAQFERQMMAATEQMQNQLQNKVHVTKHSRSSSVPVATGASDGAAFSQVGGSSKMEDVSMDAPVPAPLVSPSPALQSVLSPLPSEDPEPLSEVVDFTPEHADVVAANRKPIKVVLSCSEPLADIPPGSDRIFKWHTLSAFVDVSVRGGPSKPSFEIKSVDLSAVRKLNPYTYRCTVPKNVKVGGDRRIVIVAVRLYAGTEPVCEGVSAGVAVSLQQSWRDALAADPSSGGVDDLNRPALRGGSKSGIMAGAANGGATGGPNIRVMTQLSEETFEFRGAPMVAAPTLAESPAPASTNGIPPVAPPPAALPAPAPGGDKIKSGSSPPSSSGMGGGSDSNFPAPAPAMAMVATALPDFPNPPAKAVGNFNATPSVVGGNDAVLEAAATNTHSAHRADDYHHHKSSRRKRAMEDSASHSSIPFNNSFANVETASTVSAANNWATGPGMNSEDETMGGEIDRHCKIRFVERLSSVIAGAGNEAGPVAGPGPGSGAGSTPSEEEGLNLNDAQLNAMEDEKLDKVLDGLLVRVVESLVEMSTSSFELQEELNSPDKSGFTLLHYAALYNLQSLIPLLLSKGANPDTPTARGKLTPLHLACGAGNWAIVEVLVRNGCAVQVSDSFGSMPADHARRNGFPEIAQWLTEKTGADRQKMAELRALEEKRRTDLMELEDEANLASGAEELSGVSDPTLNGFGDPHRILLPAVDDESNKQLLQTAFSNLSLKDKLALNLLVRKRQLAMQTGEIEADGLGEGNEGEGGPSDDQGAMTNHKMASGVAPRAGSPGAISGYDDGEDDPNLPPRTQHHGADRRRRRRGRVGGESDGGGDLDVASVISESDKASLDIAMRLMNEEELEDLESRSKDIDDDLKKWMLKRNYESLKEASLYLKKTLQTNEVETGGGRRSPGSQAGDFSKSLGSARDPKAARRSLQNVKSQAIAGLVIRKNMSRLHVGSGVGGKPPTATMS